VGLTVEVKVRDFFTWKAVIVVYTETLQVGYDVTKSH
jgi:hypothetical protein